MQKNQIVRPLDANTIALIEELGDQHVSTSIETPMREDAFVMSDEDKIEKIQNNFYEIMETLGLDLTDDSLKGTPYRVAKMFVKEIFQGLNPANKPKMALFDNKYQYDQMLIEKNINVQSTCEHHFLPIYGKAHVAYISKGKVIGLSKINRIVDYFCRRPQVQERLTMQIMNELKRLLQTDDIAIYIDAQHMCVSTRGVRDLSSSTITSAFSGKFEEEQARREFFAAIHS
jgi:GTP cyclohydrolase IA